MFDYFDGEMCMHVSTLPIGYCGMSVVVGLVVDGNDSGLRYCSQHGEDMVQYYQINGRISHLARLKMKSDVNTL